MSGRQGSSTKADVGADTAGPSNSSGVADRAVHEAVHDMFRNMAECLDGEMEGAGPHLWLLIFALLPLLTAHHASAAAVLFYKQCRAWIMSFSKR